jgi:4-hydroxy-3-methylbut-2-enyl diphosphate reductase
VKIKLAKTAGFCMGVHRAVEIVLDVIKSQEGPIYTLGPLIHNPQVLAILKEKGVAVVDDPSEAPPGKVVIRAHGVPPETKKALQEAGFTIIDATCPRVIKVQAIIAKYAKQDYATLIVGDADHPEVVGLLGYAEGKGHVISDPGELDRLPPFEKVVVVAQTTQDGKIFAAVTAAVSARYPDAKVFNTICDSTHKRQAEVRELAQSVDAVVVVGGLESGNTRRLIQVAQQEGVSAFHVESEAEVNNEAVASARKVGLTAGASTPNWVIKKVYRALEALPCDKQGGGSAVFRLQRWLLLSNVYLALGAGCLSYTCALLSGLRPNLPSATMAACYILSMHILNNFIGRDAVRYNDPDRAHFYEHHKGFLLSLAVVSGATGLFMAFTLGPIPFAVLGIISVLGLLYGVKLTPGRMKIGKKIERIGDIPGSKTVLIALAWGVVTVVLPHLAVSLRITTNMLFVSLIASVSAFVRTAFFDILDMQGDRIVGQESLPIVLGEKKSLHILKQLLFIAFAMLLFAPIMALTTSLAYGLTLSVLYMAAVVQAFEKNWMVPGFRFEFIVETVFPFTAVVSLVWHLFQ